MYILDTDCLSLLERDNAESLTLQIRLDAVSPELLATTIVNYEEQMRGWLERAARATAAEQLIVAYLRLERHIQIFEGIPLLSFDERASLPFERLQKAQVRIGTMDLKIAAIALANDATVLTRNTKHFGKVPGLKVADWTG